MEKVNLSEIRVFGSAKPTQIPEFPISSPPQGSPNFGERRGPKVCDLRPNGRHHDLAASQTGTIGRREQIKGGMGE